MTKQFVLGTAGHIDHGKTALTIALTGTDTDRLPEEKARGITIELGFAKLDVPGGQVSIIDVPGHERFLRTMASGAAGLDAALLCIAADDGVMPQTTEHLAICELLGVKTGCVVVTKCDAVDAELVELVEAEVEELVVGTCFEGRPVIATSSKTGQGIDALKAYIAEMVDAADAGHAHLASQPAFLPVDRHFQKAGFGTVITGTLAMGALEVGDAVRVLPVGDNQHLDATVRGLQVHGVSAERAVAPTRVAVNLRGADNAELSRGAVIAPRDARPPEYALHAALRVLPAMRAVKENDEVALHLGTTDTLARVVPLEGDAVTPGERGMVRLVTDRPVYAFCTQRFIVRQPGGGSLCTIGGGVVIDPFPPAFKGAYKTWGPAARAMDEDAAGAGLLALAAVARFDGLAVSDVERRVPPNLDVAGALAALAQGGGLCALEQGGALRYYDSAIIESADAALIGALDAFHQAHPLAFGATPGDLAAALPPPGRSLVAPLIARLSAAGLMQADAGRVARPGRPGAEKTEATLAGVVDALRQGGFTPPSMPEWQKQSGLDAAAFADALTELRRREQVVLVTPQLAYAREVLDALADKVRAHFSTNETLDTAALKVIGGGLSRKHAIPLFEWLDKAGVTRRQGDVRVKGR